MLNIEDVARVPRAACLPLATGERAAGGTRNVHSLLVGVVTRCIRKR